MARLMCPRASAAGAVETDLQKHGLDIADDPGGLAGC